VTKALRHATKSSSHVTRCSDDTDVHDVFKVRSNQLERQRF
jgi:hypothetical protein